MSETLLNSQTVSTSLEHSTITTQTRCTVRLWILINSFSSIFVVFPIVILYWSGTWYLLDIYIYPNDPTTSSTICAVAGSLLMVMAFYLLPLLKLMLNQSQGTWKHILVSRIMVYICGGIIILYWHGWYGLQDVFIPNRLVFNMTLAISSVIILVPFRCVSALLSTPFQCTSDLTTSMLDVAPRFRTTIDNLWKYSIDSAFSCWFIHLLVVVSFRAVWNLIDSVVVPLNKKQLHAYLISIAVGLGATVVCYSLQWVCYVIARRLSSISPWLCLAFVDLYKIVCYVPNILTWYGAWGYLKDCILHHTWQGWLFHTVGIMGLLVLQVGMTISGLDIPIDGELGEGKDVFFSIEHLSMCYRSFRSTNRVWQQGVMIHEERQRLLNADSEQYPSYQ